MFPEGTRWKGCAYHCCKEPFRVAWNDANKKSFKFSSLALIVPFLKFISTYRAFFGSQLLWLDLTIILFLSVCDYTVVLRFNSGYSTKVLIPSLSKLYLRKIFFMDKPQHWKRQRQTYVLHSFLTLIWGVSWDLLEKHSVLNSDLPRVITQQAFDGCQIAGVGQVQH